MLLYTFTVKPAVILIPVFVELAPVEDKVLMLFKLILTTGEGLALAIPVTAPPVPEDGKL